MRLSEVSVPTMTLTCSTVGVCRTMQALTVLVPKFDAVETGDPVVKLSALKVDAAAIEAGEWVGDIPGSGDLRLKVRGYQNAQFRRLQQRLIDAVPRDKRRGGRVDPDEMDKITSSCLGSTVLLDWSGLEDESGAAIPYSKEMATELLTKPEYRQFREAVIYAATVVGEADAAADKADEGNSSGT